MSEVIKVDLQATRDIVEQTSVQQTFPDVIQFMQDKNGVWITSVENLTNPKFLANATIQAALAGKTATIIYAGETASAAEIPK